MVLAVRTFYWHCDACALEITHAIFFYGTWLRERCEQDHDLGYHLMKRVAVVLMARLDVQLEESAQLMMGMLRVAGI